MALLPIAALACSSGGGGGDGGTAGAGGTPSTSTAGGGGTGTTEECEGPGFGGNEKVLSIGIVQATIKDQNGQPAANTSAQACGTDICIAEFTNDAGAVTIVVNKDLKAPAFKYGDGITYAKLGAPMVAGDSMYMDVMTAKLPPVGQGDKLSPGASAKSAGVTIDIPAGSYVEVDGLIYPEEIDQLFRAVAVPIGANSPAIDASLGLEAVFGVAPMETVFCPAAKVHVPNSPQWPAGAAVEFFIHGLEVGQKWAPYGGWVKVSDGAVSADGSEVVTAEGQGLPVLSTFGVRLQK